MAALLVTLVTVVVVVVVVVVTMVVLVFMLVTMVLVMLLVTMVVVVLVMFVLVEDVVAHLAQLFIVVLHLLDNQLLKDGESEGKEGQDQAKEQPDVDHLDVGGLQKGALRLRLASGLILPLAVRWKWLGTGCTSPTWQSSGP